MNKSKIHKRDTKKRKRRWVKSPLRYPGGKSRAIKVIAPMVPDFNEYREPFLGGGSLFLHLKQTRPGKLFWVNDLYFDLYNFWVHTQSDMDALVDKVHQWRSNYTDGKQLHCFLKHNMHSFTNLEKAAAFFIFNRITFSGTTHSGGYSEDAFKNRFTESSIERLSRLADLMQSDNITISNVDYQELLKKDGDKVFIFMDPPYYSATKSALYGEKGHLHRSFDHERFAATVAECKHKYLITYDDCEYIRDLYSFTNVTPWELTYGMRNVTQGTTQTGNEVFISNYFTESDPAGHADIENQWWANNTLNDQLSNGFTWGEDNTEFA